MSGLRTHVVTFGEMLLRLSPPAGERLFESPALRTFWGGAEANVAGGLSHLGTPASHVTVLPRSAVGDSALEALHAEGIDTSQVQRVDGRVGLYFVDPGSESRALHVTYDRAQSVFAQLDPARFDWDAILRSARWLHLTGIVPALGEGPLQCATLAMDAAIRAGIPVSLDLNYRPALWAGRDPRPAMQPLARRASLLIANPGAIDVMLGVPTAGSPPEPAEAIAEMAAQVQASFDCPRIAITQREVHSATRHSWQAHFWDSAQRTLVHGGRYTLPVVDRAGGGDAFVAGLIHQLLGGASAEAAVRFATAAGALKLTMAGDVSRARSSDVERLLASAT